MVYPNVDKILYGLLLITGVTSCGPSYHLRRAVNKGAVTTSDTVYQEYKVRVERVYKDTIIREVSLGDTVVIEKERLRVKYVNLPGDSIYIQGECLPDTIVIKHPTIVNNTIKEPENMHWLRWFAAGIGVSSIFFLVILLRNQ
jgi:hypothetical protein